MNTLTASRAAIAAIALAAPLFAVSSAAQDVLTKEEVETIVRDYLLANPEILFEAADRYREREELVRAAQVEEAVRRHLPALMSAESGVALGASADEAEVLVVEFFDYHCGYCRRATDFVTGLTEEDGVRVVFQDLPILKDESRSAALAGLAAAEAGGEASYLALHRELMRAAGTLDDEAIGKAAKRAGVTKATLGAIGEDDAELDTKLALSTEIAEALGVQGTPAFVVTSPDGGTVRMVPGYAPDAVRAAIETVRG